MSPETAPGWLMALLGEILVYEQQHPKTSPVYPCFDTVLELVPKDLRIAAYGYGRRVNDERQAKYETENSTQSAG